MAFLDKLGDTLVSVGKDVTQKTKDVSGIAKLKLEIKSKEGSLKELYAEIGKSYYEAHKDEDVPEKNYFDCIAEIRDEIAKMELEILEIKKAKRCPNCGAEAKDDAEYCSVCGAKLSIIVDEDTDDSAEEEA